MAELETGGTITYLLSIIVEYYCVICYLYADEKNIKEEGLKHCIDSKYSKGSNSSGESGQSKVVLYIPFLEIWVTNSP